MDLNRQELATLAAGLQALQRYYVPMGDAAMTRQVLRQHFPHFIATGAPCGDEVEALRKRLIAELGP